MKLSAAARRLQDLSSEVLIAAVRLYQVTLSPLIGRQCRFVPTCSEYFVQAVRLRGPGRGLLLGLWRIARCNPFCHGGYDPVDPPAANQPPTGGSGRACSGRPR